jgi:hypothetical protein
MYTRPVEKRKPIREGILARQAAGNYDIFYKI